MATEHRNAGIVSHVVQHFKRYFGFEQPGLTRRQRWRIFLANEQRTFERLLGLRPGSSSCVGADGRRSPGDKPASS